VPVKENLDTTHMTDSRTVEAVSTAKMLPLDKEFMFGCMTQNHDPSILSFLSKPVVLASGVFSATDQATTFPRFDMPSSLLANTLYARKLEGNLMFKADLEFTLTVNANPFQQGRYFLCWCPSGGADSATGTADVWQSAHTFSAVQRSQLPHAEIDLSTQSKVVLEVPFVSAYSCWAAYPTTAHTLDTGAIRIFPYDAILTGSGGSITAGYTLWARFLNIQVAAAAIPHSSGSFQKKTSTHTKGRDASKQEQLSKGAGPIEKVMNLGSQLSPLLMLNPVTAPFTGVVSWATDLMGGVAASFGWSKPLNLDKNYIIQKDIMHNFCSYDALDNSKPMSYSVENRVENIKGYSGTDLDELDFGNFLSINSYIGQYFPFTTANASGDRLTSINVSPGATASTMVDANGHNVWCYTPLSWLNENFTYWRGGISYTFKMVKTKFHSGRISVSFSPTNAYIGGATVTYANLPYLNRHIIDISDYTEFTINVPFVFPVPYAETRDITGSLGTLDIFVVDELVGPSTVSTYINFLVEAKALPDFEFAVPSINTTIPVFGSPILATPHSSGNFIDFIGDTGDVAMSLAPARSCIGERITSLRQMLKIPNLMISSSAFAPNSYLNIVPFACEVAYSQPIIPITYPLFSSDLYAQLQSMFALSRGSVRFKVIHNYTVPVDDTIVVAYLTDFENYFTGRDFISSSNSDINGHTVDNNYPTSGGLVVISDVLSRGGLEVQVPAYNATHSRSGPNAICSTGGFGTINGVTNLPHQALTVYKPFGYHLGRNISRSCGDDGDFGCFVSVPPMQHAAPS